jgi:hypothetical protein
MNKTNAKYIYRLRPGYHSQKLLIEIYKGADKEYFLNDLLDALGPLQPRLRKEHSLPDEMLYCVKSDAGSFTFSIDNWGIAFMMDADNEQCMNTLKALLENDTRFQRSEVDFSKYKRANSDSE